MQYVKKDDDGHHVKCQRDDPERVGFLRDDASFVWDAPPLPKRRAVIKKVQDRMESYITEEIFKRAGGLLITPPSRINIFSI